MAFYQNEYPPNIFAKDCEELIRRCTVSKRKVNYRDFSRLWTDMHFVRMYEHRFPSEETAKVAEEAIQVAKGFIVSKSNNLEESVTALFIVYGLLNLQSFASFASVCFELKDWPALDLIDEGARRDHRSDIMYVLRSVLTKGPAKYHAALWGRGLELPLKRYLEGPQSTVLADRPKCLLQRQGRELKLIKEGTKYSKSKQDIVGSVEDPNLSGLDESLARNMAASFERLVISTRRGADECFPSTSREANEAEATEPLQEKPTTSKVNAETHLVEGGDMPAPTSSESGIKRERDPSPAHESECTASKKPKRSESFDGNDETDDALDLEM